MKENAKSSHGMASVRREMIVRTSTLGLQASLEGQHAHITRVDSVRWDLIAMPGISSTRKLVRSTWLASALMDEVIRLMRIRWSAVSLARMRSGLRMRIWYRASLR